MILRMPDKPIRISPEGFGNSIASYKDYIATAKMDGHRVMIVNDGELRFISRHNRKLDVCPEIVEAVRALNIPENSVLDGEWMARRVTEKLDHEMIYIFGSMWWENIWTGSKTEEWRVNHIIDFLKGRENKWIKMPRLATENLFAFFESTVQDWLTEGIVVKHKDSKLIGHRKESANNRLWNKVKWRDGNDGKTVTYGNAI